MRPHPPCTEGTKAIHPADLQLNGTQPEHAMALGPALRGFTPYQIVLAQVTLGAAVLVGYLYATKRSLPRGRRTWPHLTVAALLANLAPYLLFAIAERQIDSAVAGVLNATTPLFTVIVAVLVGHGARPTHLRLIGLIVGIAGTAILLAPWKSGTQFTSWGALGTY